MQVLVSGSDFTLTTPYLNPRAISCAGSNHQICLGWNAIVWVWSRQTVHSVLTSKLPGGVNLFFSQVVQTAFSTVSLIGQAGGISTAGVSVALNRCM